MLIFFAIIVNKGIPFRKNWYHNNIFLSFVIIYSFIFIFFIFIDITNLTKINWLRNYCYG